MLMVGWVQPPSPSIVIWSLRSRVPVFAGIRKNIQLYPQLVEAVPAPGHGEALLIRYSRFVATGQLGLRGPGAGERSHIKRHRLVLAFLRVFLTPRLT